MSVCYKKSDAQVSCNLDQETVLMYLSTGKYFSLDSIGSRIWTHLDQEQSLANLCALLVDEFEVDPVQCASETQAFLDELVANDLIRIVP